MYMVIDTLSRNILGEFESLTDAKTQFFRLVSAAPEAYRDLIIVSEDWDEYPVTEQEVLTAIHAEIA